MYFRNPKTINPLIVKISLGGLILIYFDFNEVKYIYSTLYYIYCKVSAELKFNYKFLNV